MASNKSSDMFGISPEIEAPDEAEMGDDTDDTDYTVCQIIPADPGWRAVLVDSSGDQRILPLACFALVEIEHDGDDIDRVVHRVVRPMIADEAGRVDDVEVYDDFVCLVPPGAEPQAVLDYVRQHQAVVGEEAEA